MGATPNFRDGQRSYTVEDRLRLVIATIPALALGTLPDGSVDFLNQRWPDYTGRTVEELQGWGWTAAIHPEDTSRLVEEWRAALARGESFTYASKGQSRSAAGENSNRQRQSVVMLEIPEGGSQCQHMT